MTPNPQASARAVTVRAMKLAREVVDRPLYLAAPAGVVLVLGLLATLTDHFGFAIAMILLLQGIIIAALLLHMRRQDGAMRALNDRIDRSDVRIIGDIARIRQAMTDPAPAESKDRP